MAKLSQPVWTVHPHVRGVYKWVTAIYPKGTGPSPRAWGLRLKTTRSIPSLRSIPTCVGFTPKTTFPRKEQGVHPHVRGVYGLS